MAVRNTRLLRGRVQADVGLGHAANGSWIGVTVELDLHDPVIKAAVDQLHAAIEIRALNQVAEALAYRNRHERTA